MEGRIDLRHEGVVVGPVHRPADVAVVGLGAP